MKKLQIYAYDPWNSQNQDVSWGVEYTDTTLYKIISEARNNYPQYHITLYYENGEITTMDPLNREQKYVQLWDLINQK